MQLILDNNESDGVKRRGDKQQGRQEKGNKEGEEHRKTISRGKKDFFCQIQSKIDYHVRAAVGARFNLQAIFLESLCECACVALYAIVSWGNPLSSQRTTHSLCSPAFFPLLSCTLSIS